jgi:uncharacterized protein (DUF2236 family)
MDMPATEARATVRGASEASLVDQARRSAAGQLEGLSGPRSASWRILRELALLAGGGRALLMQIAHPAVASAIEQHSTFRADPLGRARRTFDSMYAIHFGDLDQALETAARVRKRHCPVIGVVPGNAASTWAGRRFTARDPALMQWVQATLVDTAITTYEALVEPLGASGREAYYQEAKRTGAVLGVDPARTPKDYPSFQRYIAEMVAGRELAVGDLARGQARVLLGQPPSVALGGFLGRALTGSWLLLDQCPVRATVNGVTQVFTAGLLPAELRASFGMSWGPADEAAFRALRAGMGAVYRRLPPSMRFHPAYRAAMQRTAA